MATKKIVITFPEPFDVEEAKTILREAVSQSCKCEITYCGFSYSPIDFVLRNFELFGIDFLREIMTPEQVKDYPISLQRLPISPQRQSTASTLEILEAMLEAGCQLPTSDKFLFSLKYKPDMVFIDRLIRAGQEWSPQDVLASCSSIEMARYFIGLGAHLTFATAFRSSLDLFEYYCQECGIDVNAKYDNNTSPYFGVTYLYLIIHSYKGNNPPAITRGKIERLLALGADPDIKCGTKTPRQLYGVAAWERDFARAPFMATLGDASGAQWRLEFISDKRLKGQCLTEEGMREIELTYKWFGDELYVCYEGEFVKVK